MNGAIRTALAVIVGFAAAWAGAGLYLSRYGAHRERGIAVPAGAASAPDPSFADQEPSRSLARRIPQTLPAFSLADLDGRITPISRWQGKSLMINFWATWCAPCRREIPLLQSLQVKVSAQNGEVLGIAVDSAEEVRKFADRLKIRYPLLVGEQDALDAASALGVTSPAFPFTVFTDRRGQVVALYLGELKRPQAEAILAVVQDLNADRLALSAARSLIESRLSALAESG